MFYLRVFSIGFALTKNIINSRFIKIEKQKLFFDINFGSIVIIRGVH